MLLSIRNKTVNIEARIYMIDQHRTSSFYKKELYFIIIMYKEWFYKNHSSVGQSRSKRTIVP